MLILCQGQHDPMQHGDDWSVMHVYVGPTEGYQWLLNQEEFHIDLAENVLSCVIVVAAQTYFEDGNASELLEEMITKDYDPSDRAGKAAFGDGFALIHHAVWNSDNMFFNADFPNRIRVLSSAGADLNAFSNKA